MTSEHFGAGLAASVRRVAAAGVLMAAALLMACSVNETPQRPAVGTRDLEPAGAPAPDASSAPQAATQDQGTEIEVAPWQAALRIMDTDGDGRVSIDEHAAAAARMFSTMDTDDNAEVTVAEMAATRSTLPDARMDTERALRLIDSNGDGLLDKQEHAAATRAQFDVVDTNHDGYLDADELQADE